MDLRTLVHVLDFVPCMHRSREEFLLRMAEQLRARGWRTVFVFSGEPAGYFRERLGELNAPYLVANFDHSLAGALSLGLRLRRFRPDVLATSYLDKFSPSVPLLKKAAGARFLVVSDHSSGAVSRKSRAGLLLARARGALAGRWADRIVTVSEFVRRRDAGELYLPPEKMRVVHNGVNLERFAPAAPPANAVPVVAYAGQLIPQKGVMTLFRAAADLAARGANPFRLLVAGEGGQGPELRAFAAAHGLAGRVEFFGQIDWVPRLFATADVVVVPSEWEEAFGFVAAEAMACGACVLGSDAGAIPEVLGPAGMIFRRGDAADLTAKLAALLADAPGRERMRRAARARAVRDFSIGRSVEGFLRVLEGLEEGPARRRPARRAPNPLPHAGIDDRQAAALHATHT